MLAEQLEQVKILTEDIGDSPKQAVVDLGFGGVGAVNPGMGIIHRGRCNSLTDQQQRWRKPWPAIERPNGMEKRCWLKWQTGDAVLCTAGLNIRWLLRAVVRLSLKGLRLIGLLIVLALARESRNRIAGCVPPGSPTRLGEFCSAD